MREGSKEKSREGTQESSKQPHTYETPDIEEETIPPNGSVPTHKSGQPSHGAR